MGCDCPIVGLRGGVPNITFALRKIMFGCYETFFSYTAGVDTLTRPRYGMYRANWTWPEACDRSKRLDMLSTTALDMDLAGILERSYQWMEGPNCHDDLRCRDIRLPVVHET